MFVLSNATVNGMPVALPTLHDQALVSIDAPDFWFPPPSHDQFGISIPRPWVSPTLLKIAKPFDGSDFAAFATSLYKHCARELGIPWDYLRHLERVS